MQTKIATHTALASTDPTVTGGVIYSRMYLESLGIEGLDINAAEYYLCGGKYLPITTKPN